MKNRKEIKYESSVQGGALEMEFAGTIISLVLNKDRARRNKNQHFK